jgi:DNA processing protein
MSQAPGPISQWLLLRHAPQLGHIGIQNLLQHFASLNEIHQASHAELARLGLKSTSIEYLFQETIPDSIKRELEWAQQDGNSIIGFDDPDYPALLKTISNPPPVLYIRGNQHLLNDPQLAIVGSRHSTAGGNENAKNFAAHFSHCGLVITSGLALGIDSQAHIGALSAKGPTIAVMATGVDTIYPASNKKLASEILQTGALISEMPLGTKPLAELFPQRNRIISGLSLGVLIVEAAKRSGSLITARLAMEQSREVFAIPGSIHNPLARGCHHMIRQGAKLVESAQDVIEELAPQLRSALLETPDVPAEKQKSNSIELDNDYSRLLETLGFDRLSVDQLVERSGLSAKDVASMLLILELQGLINAEPSGHYSRINE